MALTTFVARAVLGQGKRDHPAIGEISDHFKPRISPSLHPCLNRNDQKRLEVWRLPPVAAIKKPLLFVTHQPQAALISDHRATHLRLPASSELPDRCHVTSKQY
jgi:hypothetical protein